MAARRGNLWVGTSGFHYAGWRGKFYPKALPASEWLEFYARKFDTVELNNSFYRLPEKSSFKQWHDRVPANFLFAVKYSRYGSHRRRLRAPRGHLKLFSDRVVALRRKLGPILVQLPPHWGADPKRLDAFLTARRDRWRWAVEVRDPSWLCEPVYKVMRKHKVVLCIHDLIPKHPWIQTAPWLYVRFHGTTGKYAGSYSRAQLKPYARRMNEALARGEDVYAYFNNDVEGHAIKNARTLLELCQE